jgi:hypothetical protein
MYIVYIMNLKINIWTLNFYEAIAILVVDW